LPERIVNGTECKRDSMKFSIVIPTQNRPQILVLVVKYIMNQNYKNFEVIIADNSTSDEMRTKNKELISQYLDSGKIKIFYPDHLLSPPDNFEFGLKFAQGDYVTFMTDKMILLHDALDRVKECIEKTNSDIVNWPYIIYNTCDVRNPDQQGNVLYPSSDKNTDVPFSEYSPLSHLRFKANGAISRHKETVEQYAKGKACFGFYSKKLINKIIENSGSVYGGATHDYSAMVQALCLANKAAILTNPGIFFIGLPVEKSLGSLTSISSPAALAYFKSFKNWKEIIDSLLIPGLYASQHNMVAHDYLKYLKIYNKEKYFNKINWVSSIKKDIYLIGKIWSSHDECDKQHNILNSYISKDRFFYFRYYLNNLIRIFSIKRKKISACYHLFMNKISKSSLQDSHNIPEPLSVYNVSLEKAIEIWINRT